MLVQAIIRDLVAVVHWLDSTAIDAFIRLIMQVM